MAEEYDKLRMFPLFPLPFFSAESLVGVSQMIKDLNVISFEEKVKPPYNEHVLVVDTFLGPGSVRYRDFSLYLSVHIFSV